ncbi:MAG: FG-GAP repeat domain-containing protein [Rhodopirellula sp. JB055]|uniref:FG-GAP repeat domain-containing protein n=1 Tax=Rhodopirellula sp. JB055 TaxID=3342846 RepID=UPI00370AE538
MITSEMSAQGHARIQDEVQAFCADCHVMPLASSSTKADWEAEVDQGFMLYETSGRSDLKVPAREDVVSFFKSQAPEKFDWSPWLRSVPKCEWSFKTQPIGLAIDEPSRSRPPGVTNVRWLDIGLMDSQALVYCDIGTGAVVAHWPDRNGGTTKHLATLFQPVHAEACDLDGDGYRDVIVADIGEFDANDSELGRVVWLRRKPLQEEFEQIVLLSGLGRVADARPADFDNDGDMDLVIAEFGWRSSGRIVLLENRLSVAKDSGQNPERLADNFVVHEIDDRHGTIHVPVTDLNGDGHLDFVAAISQGYETVEAFLNNGEGEFHREVVFAAADPAFGLSGIQLVDMDLDGDLDVLMTNGDSFDRGVKPYHAVWWLENEGTYPYKEHQLCRMPGVLSAKAGDFDGDGDLDVVAGSLMAGPIRDQFRDFQMASVVMLAQTEQGVFRKTSLEDHVHQHASIEVDDFDQDGKVDFAISNLLRTARGNEPDAVIWWNQSPVP